jgi:hypothetical protein
MAEATVLEYSFVGGNQSYVVLDSFLSIIDEALFHPVIEFKLSVESTRSLSGVERCERPRRALFTMPSHDDNPLSTSPDNPSKPFVSASSSLFTIEISSHNVMPSWGFRNGIEAETLRGEEVGMAKMCLKMPSRLLHCVESRNRGENENVLMTFINIYIVSRSRAAAPMGKKSCRNATLRCSRNFAPITLASVSR